MENKVAEEEKREDLVPEDREESVEIELEGVESSEKSGGEIEVEQESVSEEPKEKPVSDSKKRIDRLTKLRREAERREQDALAYAQAAKAELEETKARLQSLDQGYVQEYSGRVQSELDQAKAELRQAMSIGDTDAAVEAQTKLSSLTVAQERARQAQMQQERRAKEASEQPVAQEPQPQPQQQKPDPKAEDWAERNSWFGKDQAMTYAAFGIHKTLVEDEEFDPSSDEYYNELDKRIAEEFPHKFETNSTQSNRPVQTVASASRTAKSSGPKKVKLTPSQVAIAKKLGVSLEDYAKQVAMLSTRS